MGDIRQCSRGFLSEFIALYESFPCLWRIKSKEYSDRDKKRQAYEILVEKFKEVDDGANRETVIKKINSLRSVYRKELAKVNKFNRSGAGEYDIYKPSLWYFDLFNFLRDQETPRPSRNNMDEDEDVARDEDSTIEEAPPEQEVGEDTHESEADAGLSEAPATPMSEPSTSRSVSGSLSRNTASTQSSARKRKGVPKHDGTSEVMTLVGRKLESLKEDDVFQVFGKHVANKLRNVQSHQNTIAQKLISDILFEAEMGSLTRNFQLVDVSNRRSADFGFMSEQNNAYQQNNTPNQCGMPHRSSLQVGQYHFFSQPMSRNYPPLHTTQQPTHSQGYQTSSNMQQVSSHMTTQQGEQGQHTQNESFIKQLAGETHQMPHQTETLSEDTSQHKHSSAATFFPTFQPL